MNPNAYWVLSFSNPASGLARADAEPLAQPSAHGFMRTLSDLLDLNFLIVATSMSAPDRLRRGKLAIRSAAVGRVEMWRGRCRLLASPLPALSYAGAPLAKPCPRFHIPLIEPDRWNYHIRLSDKAPCHRPRKVISSSAANVHRPVLPMPYCLAVARLTTANATNDCGAHSLPR